MEVYAIKISEENSPLYRVYLYTLVKINVNNT